MELGVDAQIERAQEQGDKQLEEQLKATKEDIAKQRRAKKLRAKPKIDVTTINRRNKKKQLAGIALAQGMEKAKLSRLRTREANYWSVSNDRRDGTTTAEQDAANDKDKVDTADKLDLQVDENADSVEPTREPETPHLMTPQPNIADLHAKLDYDQITEKLPGISIGGGKLAPPPIFSGLEPSSGTPKKRLTLAEYRARKAA